MYKNEVYVQCTCEQCTFLPMMRGEDAEKGFSRFSIEVDCTRVPENCSFHVETRSLDR
jgi:hypothetical protein